LTRKPDLAQIVDDLLDVPVKTTLTERAAVQKTRNEQDVTRDTEPKKRKADVIGHDAGSAKTDAELKTGAIEVKRVKLTEIDMFSVQPGMESKVGDLSCRESVV